MRNIHIQVDKDDTAYHQNGISSPHWKDVQSHASKFGERRSCHWVMSLDKLWCELDKESRIAVSHDFCFIHRSHTLVKYHGNPGGKGWGRHGIAGLRDDFSEQGWLMFVVGWIVSPTKDVEVLTPEPVNVILFGNGIFADEVIRVGPNPVGMASYKKRKEEAHRGETAYTLVHEEGGLWRQGCRLEWCICNRGPPRMLRIASNQSRMQQGRALPRAFRGSMAHPNPFLSFQNQFFPF